MLDGGVKGMVGRKLTKEVLWKQKFALGQRKGICIPEDSLIIITQSTTTHILTQGSWNKTKHFGGDIKGKKWKRNLYEWDSRYVIMDTRCGVFLWLAISRL